jgi:hypothetical protein
VRFSVTPEHELCLDGETIPGQTFLLVSRDRKSRDRKLLVEVRFDDSVDQARRCQVFAEQGKAYAMNGERIPYLVDALTEGEETYGRPSRHTLWLRIPTRDLAYVGPASSVGAISTKRR